LTNNWICDACHSFNDVRSDTCYKCKVKRGQAKPQAIIPGASLPPSVSRAIGAPVARAGRRGPSLILAVIFGLAAAVLNVGLWYWLEAGIHMFRGRMALSVGLVIGLVVLFAGTLGGRRRVSFMIPVVAVVLTTITVAVGEYLIVSDALAEATAKGVTPGTIPIAPVDAVLAAVGDLSTDPFRPILWVLAISAGWLIPFAALVGSDRKAE
jgi:hypothetical protein